MTFSSAMHHFLGRAPPLKCKSGFSPDSSFLGVVPVPKFNTRCISLNQTHLHLRPISVKRTVWKVSLNLQMVSCQLCIFHIGILVFLYGMCLVLQPVPMHDQVRHFEVCILTFYRFSTCTELPTRQFS